MIKELCVVAFLTILPTVAFSQGQQTFESTMDEIGKDLGTLQQEVEHTYRVGMAPSWEVYFPEYAKVKGNAILADYKIRTTAKWAFIREGADDKAPVLTKARRGTFFKVIDKAGEWYAVDLDKSRKGLSSGWIKATEAVPEIKAVEVKESADETRQKSMSERLYEKITERVTAIRDKYKDNPYVKVTGFTVNVAMPPSVSVSFQFK